MSDIPGKRFTEIDPVFGDYLEIEDDPASMPSILGTTGHEEAYDPFDQPDEVVYFSDPVNNCKGARATCGGGS